MIEFTCPHCSSRFEIATKDIGQSGICRDCGGAFQLLPQAESGINELPDSECSQLTSRVQVEVPRRSQLKIWQLFALTTLTAVVISVAFLLFETATSQIIISIYLVGLFGYLILVLPATAARRKAARERLAKIQEYREATVDGAGENAPMER